MKMWQVGWVDQRIERAIKNHRKFLVPRLDGMYIGYAWVGQRSSTLILKVDANERGITYLTQELKCWP